MWNVMNRSLACHSSFWNLRIWIFGEAVGSVTPWRFSLGSNVEFAHVWSLFASTRIKMVRLSWRRMARQFFLLSSWFGTKQRECCSSLLFIVIQWYVSQNEMCGTLQTSVRTVQANTLSTCNAATLQDKTEMLDSESFSHSGCFELGVAMVVIAGAASWSLTQSTQRLRRFQENNRNCHESFRHVDMWKQRGMIS